MNWRHELEAWVCGVGPVVLGGVIGLFILHLVGRI